MDENKLKSLLITIDTSIKIAMQKLSDTMEKILFVVDEKNILLGTITDGDIRRGLIKGIKFSSSVKHVTHEEFSSILANSYDLEYRARQLMVKNKIEQIPILDKKGVIIDVILWTDILTESEKIEEKHLYPNKVVIMAGGKGTRLDPFTKILPKPLIPIGNKPVIEHIMERFYNSGFHNFIYTLNYKKEYLKLFLTESNFPYSIEWVEEENFMGTVGGLALLKNKIEDTFFIINCDSILEIDFLKVLDWHKDQKAAITIVGCHNEVKIPFGVLELSDSKLQRILEKPVHDVIINTGVYVMEPHIISYMQPSSFMDMNNLIDKVISNEKISVYPVCDGWFDIGQWDDYKKTVKKIGGLDSV